MSPLFLKQIQALFVFVFIVFSTFSFGLVPVKKPNSLPEPEFYREKIVQAEFGVRYDAGHIEMAVQLEGPELIQYLKDQKIQVYFEDCALAEKMQALCLQENENLTAFWELKKAKNLKENKTFPGLFLSPRIPEESTEAAQNLFLIILSEQSSTVDLYRLFFQVVIERSRVGIDSWKQESGDLQEYRPFLNKKLNALSQSFDFQIDKVDTIINQILNSLQGFDPAAPEALSLFIQKAPKEFKVNLDSEILKQALVFKDMSQVQLEILKLTTLEALVIENTLLKNVNYKKNMTIPENREELGLYLNAHHAHAEQILANLRAIADSLEKRAIAFNVSQAVEFISQDVKKIEGISNQLAGLLE